MPPPSDGVPVAIAPVGWSSRSNPESGPPVNAVHADSLHTLRALAALLVRHDRQRVRLAGRSQVRRLNREEYENKLRAVLDAPWLQVADALPEDGVKDLFCKSGERLDFSHIQLQRLLEASSRAVRLAVDAAAHKPKVRRFYAREEPTLQRFVHYRFGQMAATRSIVPLLGWQSEPEIIRNKRPMSVGSTDQATRELEAMGVFSGAYSATTTYDFTRLKAPTDGRYKIRFKTYTFMAGPNGASGGDDHGLTGGNRAWWRPDRNVTFKGRRSEPVTLYALEPGGESRWLTTFDSHPEPSVFECVVDLRTGEGIRPDAARLVRTRPGWSGNPNATQDGVPGFAMNWLEVEGPLSDSWPPASYQAVFGDSPFETTDEGRVILVGHNQEDDARGLLTRFQGRLTQEEGPGAEPSMQVFRRAIALDQDFTEALIAATSAMLCSPEFLYLESAAGPLDQHAFRERLSYFLWNGPPEADLPPEGLATSEPEVVSSTVDGMLDDPRSDRFINALLDYWLDLRDIDANAPDAALYPDYYLDEMLTESSVLETRMFFRELIARDLPVRRLVEADFAFVNERLAQHYGIPDVEGVGLRRVDLPPDSTRGGLLTQASVLRVTANGTTTSPIVRGAWVSERLLGVEVPGPPSGVDAIEPDIRGAETIRQQLEKHRSTASCNACHAKFDPVGLGLECFDIAGGWRDRYRALGNEGDPVAGYGKNGNRFVFTLAQPVDSSGTLRGGDSFTDVRELKALLTADERRLARNLLHRLIVYATGSPVSFADRAEVESVLDDAAERGFGVRSLIHGLVQSPLFGRK
ncbi:hypothetical protein Pla175_42260 [Pirellulimonas nuda]|uniref:Planctomycete cytochrome C n=2 Tax=Pirellulimonas nuda TaxID=2528009 RepID=A0A518DH61_9BACT|nr:DUF1588 domain-containing protein [Pirellulimonas nuda]QDU90813.1 hypothetical protein Pla175_42260 [Pirellulimonas nuda]